VNQDLADRQHVVAGFRLADCVFRGADRLVGESLKPKNSRQETARGRLLLKNETNGARTCGGDDIVSEHPLNAGARAVLVSQQVEDKANHTIADKWVGQVGALLRKRVKPFGKRERVPQLSAIELGGP
jgi:hypothetical protein